MDGLLIDSFPHSSTVSIRSLIWMWFVSMRCTQLNSDAGPGTYESQLGSWWARIPSCVLAASGDVSSYWKSSLVWLRGALDDGVPSDSTVDLLSSLSLVEHRKLSLASSTLCRGESSGVMNGMLMAGGFSLERRPFCRSVSLLPLAASPAAWELLTSSLCRALPPLRFALDALDSLSVSIWVFIPSPQPPSRFHSISVQSVNGTPLPVGNDEHAVQTLMNPAAVG
jgi:hypothetical protein